ncbi:MAG: carboxylate-amine ligase [Armatimonadetes bacterium]|nr:carboxylate-amine ligase [Armatimonadota bacterium]
MVETASIESQFAALQSRMPNLWNTSMRDPHAEHTVVVVPSLTLDTEELQKLHGFAHYEERMLFLLILLSHPKTRVVYVTAQPIHQSIIDYYLHLLPGVPYSHARSRLHMFCCNDTSVKTLTQKIVEKPTLIWRIKKTLGDTRDAHMVAFNVTGLEVELAVKLGVPLYGAHPRYLPFGQKSGARKLFGQVGVPHPVGFEDLRDEKDIAEAIVDLHGKSPATKRAVIKLNDGFSGDGNALYPLSPIVGKRRGGLSLRERRNVVLDTLPRRIRFQARGVTWDEYLHKFKQMQGVVESFVEGRRKASPSVQLRINPMGGIELISTHDQILGGPDGQVFIGCKFPCDPGYRAALHEAAERIARPMAARGVLGRLSIDFLTVAAEQKNGKPWDVYAVEINLRKGGTTHPFRTLQLLTGGVYDPVNGNFEMAGGEQKYYMASDNLESENYKGLQPEDLIDITTYTGLHYKSSTNTGVVFHMIGALSEFGKLGVTCIGNSPQEAQAMYDRAVQTLEEQSRTTEWMV